jgi:hypothetical protein
LAASAEPRVARLQIVAIRTIDLTRPQRSPSSDRGTASTATVSETTLTSPPSWVSVSAHSSLRKGKTADRTCRDM